jgi:hypothetical protein
LDGDGAQPRAEDELVRRDSGHPFERAQEMVRTQPRAGGETGQRQCRLRMTLDRADHAGDARDRVRRHRLGVGRSALGSRSHLGQPDAELFPRDEG